MNQFKNLQRLTEKAQRYTEALRFYMKYKEFISF